MAETSIEWTDATWNPVAGCTVLTAGCTNCYAMRMAARLDAMGVAKYKGLTRRSGGRAVWTGKVRVDEKSLDAPKLWSKPRKVFVNSMSDLFHEDVPADFICRVWRVMKETPRHTYQILTKRPDRMAELLSTAPFEILSNVWLGTSIEDGRVLHRLKDMRRVPAAIRFVSLEPLIGSVAEGDLSGIDWAIVGGESGPRAREMKPEFERATSEIIEYVGTSFSLVFIDPTGWTGYTYDLIGPVLKHTPGEVLINFMYDFVNRAAAMDDPKTIASLNAILGGPGWKQRLVHDLPLGQEIERTFREVLKKAGTFEYVLSTRIDKSTADRPHFFIAYGTRKAAGLKAFRQVEFDALRGHEKLRVGAKQFNRETRTGQNELFGPDFESNATFQSVVDQTFDTAKNWTLAFLQDRGSPIQFGVLLIKIMEQFMLRETNVKDLCVELANEGKILNTWKISGKFKPVDSSRIELGASHSEARPLLRPGCIGCRAKPHPHIRVVPATSGDSFIAPDLTGSRRYRARFVFCPC